MSSEITKHNIKIYAPAGNLESIRAAVDAGADAVYAGFQSASNLRNFAGINLSLEDMRKGVEYTHEKGRKTFITVNSYPQTNELPACFKAIDDAHEIGADAVIVSDLAVLDYTRKNYPDLTIHLSVQAGASNIESIRFFVDNFNIETVVLPRVVTVDEIRQISDKTDIEIEVFGFGSLCVNYEGKCFLSPYITGESTNTIGTCSTPKYLKFKLDDNKLSFQMNGITLNEFEKDELALMPEIVGGKYEKEKSESQWADNFLINRRQICKGRYINDATGEKSYALQPVVYLNTIDILDKLIDAGVGSIKIEGRQRNAEYVTTSVKAFRAVLDCYNTTEKLDPREIKEKLAALFEGIEPSYTCYLHK